MTNGSKVVALQLSLATTDHIATLFNPLRPPIMADYARAKKKNKIKKAAAKLASERTARREQEKLDEELFGEIIESSEEEENLMIRDGERAGGSQGPGEKYVEGLERSQMVAKNEKEIPERPFDKLPAEIISSVRYQAIERLYLLSLTLTHRSEAFANLYLCCSSLALVNDQGTSSIRSQPPIGMLLLYY